MMDMFFPQDLQADIFWNEAYEEAPPVNQSAFVAYAGPRNEFRAGSSGEGRSGVNMNKRMIEFLRRSWSPINQTQEEHEKERCFRHMMNERMRRDRQKQSYMALHSMLPLGTKSDKNSIIQMATKKIQELQRSREELLRENLEVEAKLAALEGQSLGGTKIRLRVPNPTSGVDSMVQVLQCLNVLGIKTRVIKSNFSAQEFSAELEIETEIGAAEVEKAIQITLDEAERKPPRHFEEGCKS